MQDCIDACTELERASEDCAEACLRLDGDGDVTDCFLADLDCVEVCAATNRLLGWRSRTDGPTTQAMLLACRAAASVSIAACERMLPGRPHWISCVPAAHRAIEACTALLKVFEPDAV
ncbi:four-helix bundle copper-binding protein [Cryobacterium sp. PAMC25264]|uniref:four-helix bundle copper-binding protein n=1 Tax=Cryobacterium sp. PAMC25264 TaxID=2861288 RepID=UPI001C62EB93|nr:four-helix bundle copper-binding protein [Cryobacterium sp. PAMC25264]QYF72479.1 four-helix bundle copper-binding protein [Cryobacterium sp. PAMC25264]